MFTREELQDLRGKAKKEAEVEGLSPLWSSAYIKLVEAADYLDAMIARTEEMPEPSKDGRNKE